MDDTPDTIASATLHALETRLHRIEFVLQGTSENPVSELAAIRRSGRENSLRARLNALERGLLKLAIRSKTVKDMLELREFQSFEREEGGGGWLTVVVKMHTSRRYSKM